ncbi:hypothetical protein SDC9_202842 [bioreactor metagenome]|uniref:Uncharacterized protein n=1 Tax=bioreactor metagenome TaxID=1076179 RepID=A0A645J6Q6_9ZZZZ
MEAGSGSVRRLLPLRTQIPTLSHEPDGNFEDQELLSQFAPGTAQPLKQNDAADDQREPAPAHRRPFAGTGAGTQLQDQQREHRQREEIDREPV